MEVQQGLQACENWDHTQNGTEDSNNLQVELSFTTDRLDYEYFILPPN